MECHGIDCGIELTNGPGGKFSIVVTNIGGAHEESEYTRLAKSGTDGEKSVKLQLESHAANIDFD